MIVVTALGLFPQTVLLVEAALQSIDPSLEEAAATAGAPARAVMAKIALPVVLPAITSSAVLGLIEVLGIFGPPAVIGIPSKIYVMSTQVYAELSAFPPRFEFAAALAVLFLIIVLAILIIQDRLLSGRNFTTVSGKGSLPRLVRLRGWRFAALAYALVLIALGVGIPTVVLVAVSVSKVWSAGLTPGNFTLEFYHDALFGDVRMAHSFWNTIVLALGTVVTTLVFGLQLALLTERRNDISSRLLRLVAYLPFSIPAVVFTLGVVLAFIRPPLALYGTLWIILVCYFGRFLPFAIQPLSDALRQIDISLQEAARVVGSTTFATTTRIMLPLLRFAAVSTALLVLIACLREIVSIALLFSPSTETLMMTGMLLWSEGQVQLTAAIVVLLVIAVLVIFAVARLFVRQNVTATALGGTT
jgi:iron(III) transport system permease protein